MSHIRQNLAPYDQLHAKIIRYILLKPKQLTFNFEDSFLAYCFAFPHVCNCNHKWLHYVLCIYVYIYTLKHLLAIEIFKLLNLNGLSPPIMNEVFQVKQSAPYSLRMNYDKTLEPKIWSIVTQEIKNRKSLKSYVNGNVNQFAIICNMLVLYNKMCCTCI